MAQYRKKPVIIEAVHYTPEIARSGWPQSVTDAHPWLDEAYDTDVLWNVAGREQGGELSDPHIRIRTLEGDMRANPGDWIIRGVKGEIYACKPDIFEATYETA